MTDEEFTRLFPSVKWPQTVERNDRTQIIQPLSPSAFPLGFSDPPLTKNTIPPLSIGGISNHVPTPRDKLAALLNGIYGDDPEERHRVDVLMNYADFFAGPLFGAYDFGRALGEGRYKEAILPGITAAAPFAGKPAKLFKEALKRRGLTNAAIKGAEESPAGSLIDSKPANELVQDGATGVDDVKEYPLFDPPNKPQRPLEADYTKGVKEHEVDEAGNLLVDMDGDPLIAKYKVGRITKGGHDVGLTPDQYKALAEDIIGKKIEIVPRAVIDGASGQLKYDPITKKPSYLRLADNIKKRKKRDRVLAHETGHAVHVASGLERAEPEMLEELQRNYSTLATGDEYRKALVLPPSRGYYTGAKIEHELIAEAFRAALTNPNYMKTVGPKTYATLRKWIKSNPNSPNGSNSIALAVPLSAQHLEQLDKTTEPMRLKHPRNEGCKRIFQDEV